ncbi:DUF5666 domain-containing protein [Synechococcus sp. BDU 130192]|uniref:DUF5666 domain-containing protein n=1 Tax=Synechococcus sp. BDU 130192 TaxID=2042059 RepID=UPI000C077FE3|nr:DUF5666 domain-containing protein [Synechococcus sp. BDU 130192]
MTFFGKALLATIASSGLFLTSIPAIADDDNEIEGYITSINRQDQSLTVNGIRIFASPETDYDDGLNRFSDLRVNQKVEVEYLTFRGNYIAIEIELED